MRHPIQILVVFTLHGDDVFYHCLLSMMLDNSNLIASLLHS
jgi:hypothetical protein